MRKMCKYLRRLAHFAPICVLRRLAHFAPICAGLRLLRRLAHFAPICAGLRFVIFALLCRSPSVLERLYSLNNILCLFLYLFYYWLYVLLYGSAASQRKKAQAGAKGASRRKKRKPAQIGANWRKPAQIAANWRKPAQIAQAGAKVVRKMRKLAHFSRAPKTPHVAGFGLQIIRPASLHGTYGAALNVARTTVATIKEPTGANLTIKWTG